MRCFFEPDFGLIRFSFWIRKELLGHPSYSSVYRLKVPFFWEQNRWSLLSFSFWGFMGFLGFFFSLCFLVEIPLFLILLAFWQFNFSMMLFASYSMESSETCELLENILFSIRIGWIIYDCWLGGKGKNPKRPTLTLPFSRLDLVFDSTRWQSWETVWEFNWELSDLLERSVIFSSAVGFINNFCCGLNCKCFFGEGIFLLL